MSFNVDKFMLMQFGKNSILKNDYNYLSPDYKSVIVPADSVRDLGIKIGLDGTYKEHINDVCSKANKKNGFY